MGYMRRFLFRFATFTCLALATWNAPLAGGLYITEFGDPSMGASGAGSGALAADASTAFHNPAGIMSLDTAKNHWLVSAEYIDPSLKFNKEPDTTVSTGIQGGDGNGGDAGVSAIGGGLWWARPLNEKFGLGVALNSVSAAVMEYNNSGNPNGNDYVGRYWATEVELLTITLMPSVAWRINEQWSLGFGIPIQFGALNLDVFVPAPGPLPSVPLTDSKAKISEGDDYSAAVQLSALWEATQRLRFGLIYTPENELKFNGDLNFTGPGGGIPPVIPKTDVTIPFVQTLKLHGASDISEQLTLMATIGWEDWSSFDNLLISTDAGTGALSRDWKDTWKFALGLRWRTGDAWTHYTGIAYDTSPTSASKRTADMPIDEQWRLSAGTNYAFTGGSTLGAALTYADYGDARIDNGGDWGQVVGKYSTNRILFLGVNYGW